MLFLLYGLAAEPATGTSGSIGMLHSIGPNFSGSRTVSTASFSFTLTVTDPVSGWAVVSSAGSFTVAENSGVYRFVNGLA
jgi:hypothetical protein